MKILVINTGSSSIKYELFDMADHRVMASGIAERIGEEESLIIQKNILSNGESTEIKEAVLIADHHEGMRHIVDLLVDEEYGAVRDKNEIAAVGHRVVHGGEAFHSTTIIDEEVIAAIKRNIPLAPLHNPPNLIGIEVAREAFPDALQVAVFDTAFHQTIPMRAFLYAIPFELYEKERVRRYGFHGTSHAYVAERAAEYLGRPLGELNLITIHLGNGASMAAIKNGKCVDTTMGMTPLAGLVMGTRSGDVDPALPFFLTDHLGMSPKDIDTLLNNESGLKGVCGTNDMREVIEKIDAGDSRAKIALDLYTYRIKKYMGAYFAVLEILDAVVFTAGIGENSPYVRELCSRGLNRLGMEIDLERNKLAGSGISEINSQNSEVKILVIPTNEELKIAQETKKAIANSLK
ncbi:MAG: acetate kinase [Desulfobacteraceae bacterium]|uniref:Acetate kinase n=1 Tax=Candidatus Desulfacyla euxinica TaxID=2841693 RepID=A0A8J6TA69_9DELT|nr:acetate kinase [Candidatus Desulfacyla euxinica]MBL6977423.1 acetate kinase [Desulfobacteraceae bacterium]MBL7216525.1 acetate kinase [Desulfobacteraceae bacterium]